MKANELQIGDWVTPHVYNSALEPSKIVGIHYNSYKGNDYVDWVDCEVWDELSLNEIKPIPLTTEILEKNGFRYDGGIFYCDNEDDNYQMDIHPKETNYIGKYTFICIEKECITLTELPLTYVHELQHALRLCGIEKEIEI